MNPNYQTRRNGSGCSGCIVIPIPIGCAFVLGIFITGIVILLT